MGEMSAIVRRSRYVRRGSTDLPPFTLDVAGMERMEKLFAERGTKVTLVLGDPRTEAPVREAGHAWLNGDPDAPATGAAAVLVAAGACHWGEADRLTAFADSWIARCGLVFAATAAVEFTILESTHHTYHESHVHYLAPNESCRGHGAGLGLELLLRVRAALASASDDEHAEVVAALEPYRARHLFAATATSILAPSRTDWVDQDIATAPDLYFANFLLTAVSTAAQADAIAPTTYSWSVLQTLRIPATLIDGAGTGALGLLLGWLDSRSVDVASQRRLLSLLSDLDDDVVFEALLARADTKAVTAALLEAAARFPARAMRLFAEADILLRPHVLTHRDLVEQVLPELSEPAAARVRAIEESAASVTYASGDALPLVLADPPWLRAKPVAPPIVTGLACADPITEEWLPGERESWLEAARYPHRLPVSWSEAARHVAATEPSRSAGWATSLLTHGPEDLGRPLLATWRLPEMFRAGEWLQAVAARFGIDAVPFLTDVATRSVEHLEMVLPFSSPAIAVLMADRYARRKTARQDALAWLVRHRLPAARALVPVALGKAGTGRRQAEGALLALNANGYGDVVRAGAGAYGKEVSAGIEVLLATDPLTVMPAKMPAIPAWAAPAVLPPVRLRDRAEALPFEAVTALLTMLTISKMDEYYPGLDIVREACQPEDLAELAWTLFQQWQIAGADSKQGWALEALGLFGDDETVRRLTPLILAWPGEGGHSKAVTGVNVLAAIGSDIALMRLHGIAQRAKFKGLKAVAEEKMAEVADGLGLTAAQLGDRLVPDFGLAADGSLTLDYGSRQFVVGFDEQLRPYAADSSGTRLKALPKPGVRDGATAPDEYKRFSALKKDVRTVGADQVRRLERAMVEGRRWTPEEFTQYFVEHPLVWHVVRRLVWVLFDDAGAPAGSFRVAEDRSLADSSDEPFELARDVTVGVAHPLHLGADLAAWSTVFADYEILQPFSQLGRPTYTLTEQAVEPFVRGPQMPTTRVLGFERFGWRRSAAVDNGIQTQLERKVGELTIVLELDPGIVVGGPDELPEQVFSDIYLHDGPAGYWTAKNKRLPLTALDPVAGSELVRDLTTFMTP